MKPVVKMQTQLQASNKPTMHITMILLQSCYDQLDRIAVGGSVQRGRDVVPAPELSRKLCRSIKEWMEDKIRIHDLLLVGTYLNPLYREFQFIPSHDKRLEYKRRAMAMTRKLLMDAAGRVQDNSNNENNGSAELVSQEEACGAIGNTSRNENGLLNVLLSYADSHFMPRDQSDEVSKYNCMDIGSLSIDRSVFLSDPFSCIRIWHTHKGAFPMLYKVAARVYATPASSCASERVFSAVNRIVTRDRARLDITNLENIILVRCLGRGYNDDGLEDINDTEIERSTQ